MCILRQDLKLVIEEMFRKDEGSTFQSLGTAILKDLSPNRRRGLLSSPLSRRVVHKSLILCFQHKAGASESEF